MIGSDGGYCLRLQNNDAVLEIKSVTPGSVRLSVTESGVFWGGILK